MTRILRPRKKPTITVRPHYFKQPVWKFGDNKSKSVSVTLAPWATDSGMGSATASNVSISGRMKRLHNIYGSNQWKAGHLLNRNFGGSGTWSRNLTPLTTVANRQHASIENKVSSVLTQAQQLENRKKNITYMYAVKYSVHESPEKHPQTRAPQSITVRANLQIFDKKTKVKKIITQQELKAMCKKDRIQYIQEEKEISNIPSVASKKNKN